MARIAKNQTSNPIEIGDLGGIIIPASSEYDLSIQFNQAELANSSNLITEISAGNIVLNDGSEDLSVSDAIDLLKGYQQKTIALCDGRLMFNSTARPYGSYIYFTSEGDDQTHMGKIGNGGEGNELILNHEIGQPTAQSVYMDLNCAENRTWISSGYCSWQNADNDQITFEMVCNPTVYTPTASPTPYRLYGGYMIVPAVLGAGYGDYVDIADEDIKPMYIPLNQFNARPYCFWNADYNSTTHQYENITAAPTGNGNYNIFGTEIVLSRFVNKIFVYGSTNSLINLKTDEATEIGQNMRFKLTAYTHNTDHNWSSSYVIIMYRQKTS